MTDLAVSEIFGPTFQGEGASLGRRTGFLRLARCNLDCGRGPGSTWACDTPYTWDEERFDVAGISRLLPAADVVAEVRALGADRLVVTGGEPLLQQRALLDVVRPLHAGGYAIEIETNGTIAPAPELTDVITTFNVSPKLSGSGVPSSKALRDGPLAALRDSGKAVFKLVVASTADLDEVAAIVDRHGLAPVWIMPAGTTEAEVTATARAIADDVLARGWNLSLRLHVLLWGDERGR